MDDKKFQQCLDIYRERKLSHTKPEPSGGVEAEFSFEQLGKDRQRVKIHLKFVSVLVLCLTALAACTGVVAVTITRMLDQGAVLRSQLDSIRKTSGLDRAFETDFSTEQPNIVIVTAIVRPELINSLSVTYDGGESSQTLYKGDTNDYESIASMGPMRVVDQRAFTLPTAGKKVVTARVRAEYIPAVLAAFPEYKETEQTDRAYAFELSSSGIVRLAGKDPNTAKPEVSMCNMPLDAGRWEATNSSEAISRINNGLGGAELVGYFELRRVGEYTNISCAVPAATPTHPVVSLTGLTHFEIDFILEANDPVILEPKLVDDQGRIAGTLKLAEPEPGKQTIHIDAGALKGYFGKHCDFSRVQRIDLATARKAQNNASTGTIRISRFELFGTGPVLGGPEPPEPNVIYNVPLEQERWKTAQSKHGHIELSTDSNQLVCKVRLPYVKQTDEELPWTNIETKFDEPNYKNLRAIELEVRWVSLLPITLEPKLITSKQQDTYGRQVFLKPETGYQRILVYPQDFKYYWSVDGESSGSGMNLCDVNGLSLGIARKSQEQSEQGELYIRGIRFFGSTPESRPTSAGEEKSADK